MALYLNGRVETTVGDITRFSADAIVNAANSSLMGGGGVDGAIHLAGGPEILQQCRAIRNTRYPNGLPTGEAVETLAGKLPAKWVIHTVGPVWKGGESDEPELLRRCYLNSLALASKLKLKSIAFPAISTGVYKFPKDRAAVVVSEALREFLANPTSIEKISLVFYNSLEMDLFSDHQTLEQGE